MLDWDPAPPIVSRQNADIADTLHLRDVAMATTVWLPIG